MARTIDEVLADLEAAKVGKDDYGNAADAAAVV